MSDYWEGNSDYEFDRELEQETYKRKKQMANKYPEIGAMIQKKDKDTGAAVLDHNGKATYYVKVGKKTKITVESEINGTVVKKVLKGGDFINISRPRDKYDRMLQNGNITPAEHAEKIARFEKGGDLDYIQFELTATVKE